jgi:hypothetical protein
MKNYDQTFMPNYKFLQFNRKIQLVRDIERERAVSTAAPQSRKIGFDLTFDEELTG